MEHSALRPPDSSANLQRHGMAPWQPPHPDIVAVGASAGGVEAAIRLIGALPADLPAALLLVIHRPPDKISHLAQVIAHQTRMAVEIANEGAQLRHGVCLIAPLGHHLTVMPDLTIHLLPDGFYRGNSIDVLFTSLARCAGPRTIGVILSGMLKDGTLGLKSIKEAGGVALVQQPAEAAHPEMPMNAISAVKPVDLVGRLDMLSREIRRRTTPLPGESPPV